MDYTAVGQTTHLAARMEQLADPGTTLLTPATLGLAEGFVNATALGPMTVKGLAAPVEVHQLVGVSAVPSRLQAAVARGLSPFVGRDAEIEHLGRALDRAGQGHGQVVAMVGEPGVGKSRLALELKRSGRLDGWLVLEARAVSHGTSSSYLPIVGLLKDYLRLGDHVSPQEVRETTTRTVLALDRTLEAAIPALHALLDVSDDREWQALDPRERRQRTNDAIKRLVLREALARPVLMIAEDLHWIDPESQALLDTVVDTLPSARVLLLVNYRPEYEHRWGGKTTYTQLRLDVLSAPRAVELLRELLGSDDSLAPLQALLIQRTEGNPFFLEESVRSLVETGALTGERGAYRLVTAVDNVQVPATVHTILAARIDRMPGEEKQLLQSAAVVVRDVPFALLAAIAEEPDDVLHRGLAGLQGAELLYEMRLFPDRELSFKHALTHDVAYQGILKERRRELHARTVEAMEQVYGEGLGEHVERLVDHAVRGEVWDKAATYGTRAGNRAADRSEHVQIARGFFETALDALARVPESAETIRQAIEARCFLGSMLYALGDAEAYVRRMEEAQALAERVGDDDSLARVLSLTTNALQYAGDLAGARAAGERAVALARELGHAFHEINASINFGMVCETVGDTRHAAALFERAADLLARGLERDRMGRTIYPAVTARNELGSCQAALGNFDAAIATADAAIRLAESISHAPSILSARYEACYGLLCRGHFHEAISRLEVIRPELTAAGMSAWALQANAMLGYALAMTGRRPEGITLLRDAAAHMGRGRRTHEVRVTSYLAEALLRDGRTSEASEMVDRALRLARERSERGSEALGLYLRAETAVAETAPEAATAKREFVAALGLAGELGWRPIVARAHLGLGRLLRRGRHQDAHEHLTIAAAMLREMGMRYWLPEAEAEMKEG